ncbi:UPF0182 family protein [Haloglycomyces albus]|uniref:UPF0182 family membrane protein n=1 Tax=Haloglycomyces albus TaxID=526067 RepID=UPI0004AF0882|nr:UPF0182 family protein [Haloglycomyces albus]
MANNRTPTPPRISRRGRYVLIFLVAAIVLLSSLGWLVSLRTDYLWYDSVGYSNVFSTMLWNRLGLFLAGMVVLGGWTALNLYLAWRFKPDTWMASAASDNMRQYRELISPKIAWWIVGAGVIVGIFAGMNAQGRWQDWLLFKEGGTFGWTDPIMDKDAGFYVFQLPFIHFLVGVGFAAVVIGLIAAFAMYYLYGGLRFSGAGDRMSTAARVHLSLLVAMFLGLKAVAYYFDRFDFTTQDNPVTDIVGGGYTEITALMNAKNALIWVSVIAALVVVVFSWGFIRSLLLPGAALALVLVTAIAAGGIYPMVVRNFQVDPNVPQKEGEYAQHTIDGTRYGFDMQAVAEEEVDEGDDVPDELTAHYMEMSNFGVSSRPDAEAMAEDTGTVDNIRQMDPSIVADTFTQRQQPRGFYGFNDKLDVDRYTYENEDGETVTEDMVVGVRELDPSRYTDSQQDWTVRHTVYTHGWGFVAAPTNEICEGGPFFVSGIMRTEEVDSGGCESNEDYIKTDRPQIYYGMLNNDYAIVGVPEGDDPREFDRPVPDVSSDEAEDELDEIEDEDETEIVGDEVRTTYAGGGGVKIDNMFRRMMYAWEFQEPRFLLSDRINEESELLYKRNVRERVEEVAPFLTAGTDPYPAVVDGEIVWVIDGYTTSDNFPYSDRVNLAAATQDTFSGNGVAQMENEDVNYMRSSVKAVVNAYDGSVDLYEFDEEDPILKAWDAIYGEDMVIPKEDTPQELADHFRYASDMFKVQRNVLQRYHVNDARTFIEGSEMWTVSNDPAASSESTQPAYYVYATYPGQESENFQLTSNFTPRNRETAMSSFMTGYYDENNEPRLQVFEITGGDNPSVGQVHQTITSNQQVAPDLRLYEQQNQSVEWGNMLALPVGNGILYYEPMYLRRESSAGATSLPLLRQVAVYYGGYVGYAEEFGDAIEQVVEQYVSGAEPEDIEGVDEPEDPEAEPDEPDEPTEPPTSGEVPNTPEVQAALDDVRSATEAVKEASEAGDLSALGDAINELDEALKEFDRAVDEAS